MEDDALVLNKTTKQLRKQVESLMAKKEDLKNHSHRSNVRLYAYLKMLKRGEMHLVPFRKNGSSKYWVLNHFQRTEFQMALGGTPTHHVEHIKVLNYKDKTK